MTVNEENAEIYFTDYPIGDSNPSKLTHVKGKAFLIYFSNTSVVIGPHRTAGELNETLKKIYPEYIIIWKLEGCKATPINFKPTES